MSSSKFSQRFKTIGSVLIVAILACVLLLSGITPKMQKGYNEEFVAHVDERQIKREEYLERRDRLTEQARNQYGEMYGKIMKYLNLEQSSIDSIIDEVLISRVFESFNLITSPSMLIERISKMPYFSSGRVDKQGLRSYIGLLGMTQEAFEKALSREILDEQLQNTFKDIGRLTEHEVGVFNKIKNTKKSFNYIEIESQSFVSKVSIDDDEALKTYYGEHQEKYLKPRGVKFAFVSFPLSDFLNSVEITDEDLKSAYEQEKHNYREPKSYHLRKILIRKEAALGENATDTVPTSTEQTTKSEDTKQKFAESVRLRIDKGEEFSKVASEVSEDEATKANGGDLGWMSYPSVPAYFRSQVDKLDVGGITALITTAQGYEIVYLEDSKQSRDKELSEIKDMLLTKLKEEQAPIYAEEAAHSFLDKLESSKKEIAEIAKEEHRQFTLLDKAVNARESSPGVEPALVLKAMDLEEGKSNVVSVSGNSFVIEVQEIVDSRIPELSEVKDAVVAEYKQVKSKELAKDYAESLLAKLSTNNTTETSADIKSTQFSDLAKAESLEVKNIELVKQEDAHSGPFSVLENARKAFQLSLDKPFAKELFVQGDSFFIMQLTAVESPKKDASTDVDLANLRKSEREASGQRLYASLIAKLRKQSDIWVDPKLLDKEN